MTRSDLLGERLNLYERMCHGNFQSAAVFCYLAGSFTSTTFPLLRFVWRLNLCGVR
jgi:hypothetical protein